MDKPLLKTHILIWSALLMIAVPSFGAEAAWEPVFKPDDKEEQQHQRLREIQSLPIDKVTLATVKDGLKLWKVQEAFLLDGIFETQSQFRNVRVVDDHVEIEQSNGPTIWVMFDKKKNPRKVTVFTVLRFARPASLAPKQALLKRAVALASEKTSPFGDVAFALAGGDPSNPTGIMQVVAMAFNDHVDLIKLAKMSNQLNMSLIAFQRASVDADNLFAEHAGIGLGLEKRGKFFVVTDVAPNSVAEKAGITQGSGIVAVDGESTLNRSMGEVIDMVKGQKGSEVAVSIVREDGSQQTFKIIREPLTQTSKPKPSRNP